MDYWYKEVSILMLFSIRQTADRTTLGATHLLARLYTPENDTFGIIAVWTDIRYLMLLKNADAQSKHSQIPNKQSS